MAFLGILDAEPGSCLLVSQSGEKVASTDEDLVGGGRQLVDIVDEEPTVSVVDT